jgi:predicted alpha-1,2-mannosidase
MTDTSTIRKDKSKFPFSHKNESAKPGYYQVQLDNKIKCELTANKRTGFHRYSYPTNIGWLLLDMGFQINWDKTTSGSLKILNDSTIIGYRFSTGWAKGQKIYFAARFNHGFQSVTFVNDSVRNGNTAIGNKLKAAVKFTTASPLEVRVSISSVSEENALLELNVSNAATFDATAKSAESLWEKELQKIKINTNDKALATKFYTSLYRTCLAPVVHSDASGAYQTHDNLQKKFIKGKEKYTVFSQWDVFRALNPLFTITQTDRLPDMINSMLQLYEDNGLLPVWDLSTWEANTMTGYHSIPIIADAILKDIKGFDYNLAYEAMKKSAYQKIRGTPAYIQYGYVPQDKHGWSVTMTLEYAFDDWCIAQVAKKLNQISDYNLFMQRAQSYKVLFDSSTGFMRAKDSNGKFIEPFDPLLSEHGFDGQYIEGTAWQHSFFVPHDVEGLAKLYGGKENLVKKLDDLFMAPSELHGENTSADVSGLIGQYAHGNEPSHHIIYMYTALGHPQKTAKWVKVVTDSMYKTGPDGLTGNDDCGQMSAWYIWSALGMYPMNPSAGQYVFGLPLIKNASITLPNKKILTIQTIENKSTKLSEKYVSSVYLNNRKLTNGFITHQEILEGGILKFILN